MTPWVAHREDVTWDRKREVKVAVTDSDPVNARILKLATDLGNTVLAKKAANDLQRSVVPGCVICAQHANEQITASKPERLQGSVGRHCFTKSCKY